MIAPRLPVVETILFAQNAIINAATGNPSFVEVFTLITPPALPAIVAFHAIVILRGRVAEAIELGLEILSSDGSSLWKGLVPIPEQKDDLLYVDVGAGPMFVREGPEIRAVIAINGKETYQKSLTIRTGVPLETVRTTTSIEGAP